MTDKVNIKTDIVTPLKETFEQKSKKKTSWGNTPSDDNYPSEKLVKSTFDQMNTLYDSIINGKESLSNKTSSWNDTTNDTRYPTEKLVKDSLDGKVDKVNGKGLSTEDFTSALKSKLEGIEAQANKITVDSSLSSTSENPVQNKAIHTALGNKADSSSLSNYILTSKILSDLDNATDNTQVVGALELKEVIANVEAGVPNGVELEANKVSSWSGTTNNTHYPTEKLVKDSLDAKLDDSQLVTSISNTSDNNHMPSAKAVYDYVNSIPKWTTQVANNVASLPQTGSVGVFYLVPNSSNESQNAYDEYFWNESSSAYEKFGTKTIDISNLVTLDDVLEYINNNGELSLSTSGTDAGYLVFRVS